MVTNMQNNMDRRDNRAIFWAILAIVLLIAAVYAMDTVFRSNTSSPTLADTQSETTSGTNPNATSSPTPLTPEQNKTP